jgi:hypothetical protein
MSSDLEYVTTQEMLVELSNRHETCIFAGLPLAQGEKVTFHTSGSRVTMIGMAQALQDDVRELRRRENA